jgi:hypothetical protein
MMNNHLPMNKKILWIAGGVLLAIIILGSIAWLGDGLVVMIRSHMGM